MNTTKLFFSIIILTALVFIAAQAAMAGCNATPGNDPLEPDPQAKGTKFEGPIAVYYDQNGTTVDQSDDEICWFLRLRKGSTYYSFANCTDATVNNGPLSLSEFVTDARDLIKEYVFPEIAIPAIYDCTAGGDCPTALLKSYDQDVNRDESLGTASESFFVMDVLVAVED